MKQLFTFFLLPFILINVVFAQCPNDIKVQNIIKPTCGSTNGEFNVLLSNHSSNVEVSINNGVNYFPTGGGGTNAGSLTFTGLSANLYHLVIKVAGSVQICQSFDFILRADYGASYTVTPASASNCSLNGSLVLGGGVLATDSVSWLSNLTPSFVQVGSLTANTIPNLGPGIYYVIFKSSSGGNYCYSTHTVTIANTGTACPTTIVCGNAADSNNLFPNGTFGKGGNADGTNAQINGPALAAGLTQYTYQPLGAFGPEDGFYSIANNTYAGSNILNTPFAGTWYDGYDHDYVVTAQKNGYQLVVNASYDPDIVIQATITNLCPHKKYQFSAYIRDLDRSGGQIPANLSFLVDGVGLYTTGDIPTGAGSAWQLVGFAFQPNGSTATISIRNNQTGGSGNDWALDDIYVGDCLPTIDLHPKTATCGAPPTQVDAAIYDPTHLYTVYQWQVDSADGNGFVDEGPLQTIPPGGFTALDSFTASHNLPVPLTVHHNGWKYRIKFGTVASDLSSPACYYTGNQHLYVSGCELILPIKFMGIRTQLNNNTGNVFWQVADQTDVDHYEIEKSNDGKRFSFIRSVTATFALHDNYFSTDNNLFNGLNYYRIKAVDKNGKYLYSKITTLYWKENTNTVKLLFNPVSDYVSLSTPLNVKIKTAIIIDAIGRTVLKRDDLLNGNNNIEVNNLPVGFYTIKIISSRNEVSNLSFIKK